MVDLSGGQDGPIEHGFSNTVFIVPAIIFISLTEMEGMEPGENPSLPEMPSFDELLSVLDKLNLTDDDRESLKEGLLGKSEFSEETLKNFMASNAQVIPGYSLMSYAIMLSGVALFSIFAFGLYKLYQSTREDTKEKEKKRLKRETRRRRRR